ncbi:MAG: bifunctional adenosylcobinamide kinase/adenosylcobinamide-phosphate guanylyltransferase [Pseudomonadota bacterium]
MGRVTFLLGGARSGKSTRALALAVNAPRTFLATGEPFDDEMADRIQAHKAERGPDWGLIEAPLEIARAVEAHDHGTLVIDCLTLWLNNLIYHQRDVDAESARLLAALGATPTPAHIILVSNEVGLAIAPENALARRFRDMQGRLNQQVAAAADHVELLVAGLPVTVKAAR